MADSVVFVKVFNMIKYGELVLESIEIAINSILKMDVLYSFPKDMSARLEKKFIVVEIVGENITNEQKNLIKSYLENSFPQKCQVI